MPRTGNSWTRSGCSTVLSAKQVSGLLETLCGLADRAPTSWESLSQTSENKCVVQTPTQRFESRRCTTARRGICVFQDSGGRLCALIGVPCSAGSACSALSATLQIYCFKTNRPVLRVLKLTPRRGTPMRVHKRPPESFKMRCGSR